MLQKPATDEEIEARRLLHEERFTDRPAPQQPTGHRPGSLGKIEVMRQRVAAGEHLHHDQDAKDMVRQRTGPLRTLEGLSQEG
jgi:hypothetical protein